MNLSKTTRKIRACENDAAAQLLLENALDLILRGKLSLYENGTFSSGSVRLSMGNRGLLHIDDFEVEGVANDVFDVVAIRRPAARSV